MQDMCYLLLCLLLPPIGVYMCVRAEYKHYNQPIPSDDHRILASVCFTLMFIIPGILFALLVFMGVFRGADTDQLNVNSPQNNKNGGMNGGGGGGQQQVMMAQPPPGPTVVIMVQPQ